MDDSDNSPGWKYAEYEMKGVPLRVEIGPKDMEKEQCVIARRDTGEKVFVPLSELEETVKRLLDAVTTICSHGAEKPGGEHLRHLHLRRPRPSPRAKVGSSGPSGAALWSASWP